jgi:signal transduction histidine kinase
VALGSLRSRMLLGVMLWTIGLLATGHIVSVALMHWYPDLLLIAHGSGLAFIALACIMAGLSQVRRGLLPINQLRARLAAMRAGRNRHVEGRYPAEVQPLVDDLNELLDDRERTVTRALARAGDLAHGLKTPLAVLSQEADRAAAAGHADLAATISQQVRRMQRYVDYHLAHARAAAARSAPNTSCLVSASAEGLARTLRRLHAERGLTIAIEVASGHAVRGRREDLDEMLGNLLDNGCKWATSQVSVQSSQADGRIVITVDDDGPGLDPALRDEVLQRGVRADEAAPGSGLGLAIVRDLAEVYGGSVALSRSPAGGVRARLQLPAATTAP